MISSRLFFPFVNWIASSVPFTSPGFSPFRFAISIARSTLIGSIAIRLPSVLLRLGSGTGPQGYLKIWGRRNRGGVWTQGRNTVKAPDPMPSQGEAPFGGARGIESKHAPLSAQRGARRHRGHPHGRLGAGPADADPVRGEPQLPPDAEVPAFPRERRADDGTAGGPSPLTDARKGGGL